MKTVRFLPLAFVAGVEGFALFAPYLLLVLAAGHWMKRSRRSKTMNDER